MTLSLRLARFSPALCLLGCLALAYGRPQPARPGGQTPVTQNGKAQTTLDAPITEKAWANELIRRQPGFFVPNLGQWEHGARFMHRSGPMTLFLEDRGWVLDLVQHPVEDKAGPQDVGPHRPGSSTAHPAMPGDPGEGKPYQKIRGVALQMTFEGDAYVPEIIGEKKLPGHHNYFLGNDESRWRTGVPLYGSVRYENLYPGIDLRLREMNGVPEYDLLLQPGADLSRVTVHVEGADALRIAKDGSLVIETELGPVTQPVPKTWQVGIDGSRQEVACEYTLLSSERFAFDAPGWDGTSHLTIDPGLIWSTVLGGSRIDLVSAISVDASGVVTVAGMTGSTNFPTTSGAYDRSLGGSSPLGNSDAFVSRLDPSKAGSAQLVYSTFLGGRGNDYASALAVDGSGVVTVAGYTFATNFPTTSGAYKTTHYFGAYDAFVSRLDTSKTGNAQLVYSTFLGGSSPDYGKEVTVDASGVMTVAGYTSSTNFPTSSGAYDTTHNGSYDVFVSRLDPSKIGSAQLVYSTFLGGSGSDSASTLSVDASGMLTVAGGTSSTSFPTTSGAYDTTHNGGYDVFVSRLDPSKTGSAQLVYSTFLGGSSSDYGYELSVDASGVVTVAGYTGSVKFPTTSGAYDTTYNFSTDAFVSRLDPSKTGTAQLVYSTFLGGSGGDSTIALSVDASGVVSVAGNTISTNFPTTSGAFDTTYNGGWDVFVSRLDPNKTGSAQLVYSTFLGGNRSDRTYAVSVDAGGVVTVAGQTYYSTNFPTTSKGYDTTHNGYFDAFVSRLSMGVAFYADRYELSMKQPGTQQKLTLNAGKTHAGQSYWIFGSATGTIPGLTLFGVHIPLNPDPYTDFTIGSPGVNPPFLRFRGTLDAAGAGSASFIIPPNLPPLAGFTLHHAYLVYDAQNVWQMGSNPVPLRLY